MYSVRAARGLLGWRRSLNEYSCLCGPLRTFYYRLQRSLYTVGVRQCRYRLSIDSSTALRLCSYIGRGAGSRDKPRPWRRVLPSTTRSPLRPPPPVTPSPPAPPLPTPPPPLLPPGPVIATGAYRADLFEVDAPVAVQA